MKILQCDINGCSNNSINSKIKIYELSAALSEQSGYKHICKTHLSELGDNTIIDEQEEKVILMADIRGGDLSKITIYTDGACKGNPGKSASGIVVYKNNERPILYSSNYEENGTNNTAELKAFYQGLLIAKEESLYFNKITIKSDSQYTINSITKWAAGWEKNGWKKKNGEIKNLELIKKIYYLYQNLKEMLMVEYVKGHAGIEGNELADFAANKGIELQAVNKIELEEDISSLLCI